MSSSFNSKKDSPSTPWYGWGSLKVSHPLAPLSYPSRKSTNQPELTAVYLAQSLSCTFKHLNHLFTEVIIPEPIRELEYCLTCKTHLLGVAIRTFKQTRQQLLRERSRMNTRLASYELKINCESYSWLSWLCMFAPFATSSPVDVFLLSCESKHSLWNRVLRRGVQKLQTISVSCLMSHVSYVYQKHRKVLFMTESGGDTPGCDGNPSGSDDPPECMCTESLLEVDYPTSLTT